MSSPSFQSTRQVTFHGKVSADIDEKAIRFEDPKELVMALAHAKADAILGDAVEVPTIEGKVKIKIEAGTQPGKIMRLRGKGIPEINGYGKGDLLVNINVWIPKNLSNEEQKLFEKMSQSDNFTPVPGKTEGSFFSRMKNFFEQ